MPILEVICRDCGHTGEVITLAASEAARCPSCGGANTGRLMSATSSLTGKAPAGLPGIKDTGCCGSRPGAAGCAGPGSCCGKSAP